MAKQYNIICAGCKKPIDDEIIGKRHYTKKQLRGSKRLFYHDRMCRAQHDYENGRYSEMSRAGVAARSSRKENEFV